MAAVGHYAVRGATVTYAGSPPPLITYIEGASPGTAGSIFMANRSLWVTELGLWSGNGILVDAHDVGLWTSGGTLLASVTIPAGNTAPLVNGYRWVALAAPISLTTGSSYVLGAAFPSDGGGNRDGLWGTAPINDAFTLLADRNLNTPTYGLVFPTHSVNDPAVTGWFGPNLLAVTEIPEPSTIVLLAMCTGVSLCRRSSHLLTGSATRGRSCDCVAESRGAR